MLVSQRGSARRRHGLPSISMEFLIVLVVVLILLLLAVPYYLGFIGRANDAAAQANIRSATPAVEAYFLLTNSSYVGLDLHWLQTFEPGLKLNDPGSTPSKQTAATYCVSSTVGGKTWYKAGPSAPITRTAC